MYKRLSLLILITISLSFNTLWSQESAAKFSDIPIRDRIYFGGNFGLQFGNVLTYIEISPIVGLWVHPKVLLGGGPLYRYYKRNDINFEENQYGLRVFGRYHFVENLFAHAEYELLNLTDYRIQPDSPRTNLSSTLIGGGYVQNLGRSSVFVMVLFNLSESELTPYANPVIRVGFSVGL